MHPYRIPVWKEAPFIRIILPLMAGIFFQWNMPLGKNLIFHLLAFFSTGFSLFYYFPLSLRFRFRFFQTGLILALIFLMGMLITWNRDLRNHNNWYGNNALSTDKLVVLINEPLIEKENSFKTIVLVKQVVTNKEVKSVKGTMLLYFKKESDVVNLHYGDLILINKPFETINKSGNPGEFNNQRYQAFQQIYHQIYLSAADYVKLPLQEYSRIDQFIFSLKDYTIHVLQKYFKEVKTLGIAEALLIGYKNDLDKDLVQAYSNTGVVHIIAISGLHLGLIYMVLLWLFNSIPVVNKSNVLKSIAVVSCLWIFSLLTGASASVLRSAVMFTCIIIGKVFQKTSSIYNSLAASAFILLCYNPYFLWDVGFQLSYLAIIGIIWLQKPILHLLLVKSFLPQKIWEMTSITIAAQIVTFPICLFYFHQFPNLFLLTNLIAVPLSTIILFAEIGLVCFSWFSLLGNYLAIITEKLIVLLNTVIEFLNKIPFSATQNIYADEYSTIFLYGFVVFFIYGLILKKKSSLKAAFFFVTVFATVQSFANYKLLHQIKMVVYQYPRKQSIDFIFQNQFYFFGDSNLNMKSKRQIYYLKDKKDFLSGLQIETNKAVFYDKKIMILSANEQYAAGSEKLQLDFLILSKNAHVSIARILQFAQPTLIVMDASNSFWKISKWKKECDSLHQQYYSIPERGAFVCTIP